MVWCRYLQGRAIASLQNPVKDAPMQDSQHTTDAQWSCRRMNLMERFSPVMEIAQASVAHAAIHHVELHHTVVYLW